MTPRRSVGPNPEGVSNGAPAVGGNGADTPPPAPTPTVAVDAGLLRHWRGQIDALPEGYPGRAETLAKVDEALKVESDPNLRPAILNWAPTVPDERPSEHIRNGLQMLYELETLLQSSGDYGQSRRALLADVKRRLGWALRGLAPHAL